MTLQEFIAKVRQLKDTILSTLSVQGKLTIPEMMTAIIGIATEVSTFITQIADPTIPNDVRKALVMEAALAAFDKLWAMVPFFGIFKIVLTPIVRQLFTQLIDGTIEKIYQTYIKPKVPPTPSI